MAEVVGFRSRNRVLFGASMLVISLFSLPVHAELFVYEPFDYPAGEDLLGKNGGHRLYRRLADGNRGDPRRTPR